MIDKRLLRMKVGERILLKMQGLSYQTAHVVWVEEGEAGLAFEQPLYGPVIEHLKRQLSDCASAAS